MGSKDFINRATGEIARAEERARHISDKVNARLDHGKEKVGKLTARVVGHIDDATKLVTAAQGALNRVLPLADGTAIQRGLNALSNGAAKLAASKIAEVKAAAGKLTAAVGGLSKSFKALTGIGAGGPGGAAADAAQAVSSLAKKTDDAAPAAAAATPHLLILSAEDGTRYHFGLSGAAFDHLKRQANFNIAAQERLSRPEALQAVGQGSESLTLSGAIYAAFRQGGGELEKLRAIGRALKPLLLTTGYGEVLGRWYMTSLSEDQETLMADGAARKQTFTLEFKRYGDDYQNV
ncbi:phage tail protein [Massilia sp. YIM B04103]|uniref:phage tail protein n=1 Tax=Massilia sp. YIM B04103 TaxID=2963106 RepID=UPI002108A377|nr:phage tail protein [Massilia sp. YIM B04103]